MKRRVCASLLALCSLIRGAERKSDASIVGKVLKYGSIAIGSLDTVHTAALCLIWLKYCYNYLNIKEADKQKYVFSYDVAVNLPCLSWVPFIHTSDDIRVLTAGTVLGDLISYGGCKLGQHLDKDDANQEKKNSKETVSDKNKSSKPEDKNQSLHEKSEKSKI